MLRTTLKAGNSSTSQRGTWGSCYHREEPGLLNQWKLIRGRREKSRQGFIGTPAAAGGVTTGSFACLLTRVAERGEAGSLYAVRVGAGPGAGPEGWLSGLPAPWVVVCAGGMHSTLLLFLAL